MLQEGSGFESQPYISCLGSLFGTRGRHLKGVRCQEETRNHSSVVYPGRGTMLWGCMFLTGPGTPVRVEGRLNPA